MPAISTMQFDTVGCHIMLTAPCIIMGIEDLVAKAVHNCQITAQIVSQGKVRGENPIRLYNDDIAVQIIELSEQQDMVKAQQMMIKYKNIFISSNRIDC